MTRMRMVIMMVKWCDMMRGAEGDRLHTCPGFIMMIHDCFWLETLMPKLPRKCIQIQTAFPGHPGTQPPARAHHVPVWQHLAHSSFILWVSGSKPPLLPTSAESLRSHKDLWKELSGSAPTGFSRKSAIPRQKSESPCSGKSRVGNNCPHSCFFHTQLCGLRWF